MNYIVTGANSGLGLDTARQLALLPQTKMVYLACRTKAKALKAIDDIAQIGKAPKSKLTFLYFDASVDKDTIERSILDSLPAGETINGLILNAGGMVSQVNVTSQAWVRNACTCLLLSTFHSCARTGTRPLR